MIKIKALNEIGSSEDDYDSSQSNNQQLYNTETQEENLQALYGDYLRLMASNQTEDAKECLLRLFGLIKDLDEGQASPVQKNLKYLTYRNLGDLFADKIEFYIEALAIESSDINLWIKTARRAYADLDDFVLARNCLEYAFRLNPRNWLVIDLLIDCYFVLHDYSNCVQLCRHAMQLEAGYAKSHVLLAEIQRKADRTLSDDLRDLRIDKQLAATSSQKILPKLDAMRTKRSVNVERDRLKRLEIERDQCLELKVNLKSDTLNQLGVSLVKLYSELKQKEISVETRVKIVKLNEPGEHTGLHTTNSLPSANEESIQSNSEDAKSKQSSQLNPPASQPANNTQNSQLNKDEGSQTKSSQNSSANFPFEYVDKRRSTRVQRCIQNKNTKDLDENALLERITSLFDELCGDVGDKEKSADSKNKDASGRKSSQPVGSLQERECFGQFIKQLDQLARPTVLNILRLFLHFSSTELRGLPLPTVYNDLYTIYRHQNPLPDSSFSFLSNESVQTAEFWCILAANETKFDIREASFLTELLVFLEANLDEQQFLAFLIKLFILRGIHETNLEFLELARSKLDQLSSPIYNVNGEEITPQLIKALICSQSINNLQRLFEEQRYEQLFELLTPELQLSENDLKIICRAIVDSKQYEKGVEIFANRETLSTICFDTLLACYKKLSNFPINGRLVRKVLQIARTQATVQSWSTLLAIMMAAPPDAVQQEQILRYIELSHQYLGNKSRCNAHSGEYLLLVLDYLINVCPNDFDDLVWRCFNCLFGFTKKNYASAFKPHCNTHVKISFENCLLLYNYVQPEELPEFDTANKSNTVSSEIRDLLLQIVELIPSTYHPRNYLATLDDYLENGKPLSNSRNFQPNQITQNLFYLLADYYFKNKEFDKAMQYYRLDVCVSHHRFDSWAAIALILTSAVDEQILNDTSDYYDADLIYSKSVQAIRCFSNALRLDKANTKIWIEFGNFVYNIGSYSSKMKKTILYFDLHEQEKPRTEIAELEKRIEEMFEHAEYCFKSSLKTDCEDEAWLHYYVLGKIAEKHNALRALHYYDLADKHLYLTGACYPEKINYYNPKHLSVEALEIHYRIHACALKSLLSGKNPKIKALTRTKTYLLSALRSPFVKRSEKDKTAAAHPFSKTEHAEGVFNCLSDLIDMTIEKVENREAEIKMTIINLCIFGLKRCLIRFQNHYRSYYRLAHYYFVIGNFAAARSVLLNSFEDIDILTGTKTPIPGLFQDRKSNNFFNGIWRIPVDDVERPGSFSNHMYKCILLLIQVCTGQGDYNFLISNLVINLHRTPDVNKKYLRDCERLGLTKKAFENARLLILQQLFVQTNPEAKRAKFIEISQALDRLTKMNLFTRKVQELLQCCVKHVQQSCAIQNF